MSYRMDLAFSDTVKAIQARKGSRDNYARMAERDDWPDRIDPGLAEFIQAQTSVFFGTVSGDGQPYIQHRGGPPGFLKILDEHTIGFADFIGNRQYISQGNLEENPRAFLFLMDYSTPQRVKIWGEAKVIEGNNELVQQLMPTDYKARAEQVVLFTVKLWNVNCPQHIPRRVALDDVYEALAERDQKIAQLEQELAALRGESS